MIARESEEAQRVERLQDELTVSEERVTTMLAARRRVSNRFVLLRLASFAVGVFAFFATVAVADARWAWYGTVPSITAFILLVRFHRPTKVEMARLLRLASLLARKRSRIAEDPVAPVTDAALRDPVGPENPDDQRWTLPIPVREDLGLFEGRRHLFGIASGAASSRLGRLELSTRLVHGSLDPAAISNRSDAARALLASKRTRHLLEQAFAAIEDGPSDHAREFAREGDLDIPDEARLRLLPFLTAANVSLVTAAAAFEWNPGLLGALLISIAGSRLFRRTLARTVPIRQGFESLRSTMSACIAIHEVLTEDATLDDGPELDVLRRDIAAITAGDPPLAFALRKLSALDIYKVGLPYVVFNWLTFWDLHHLAPLARFGRTRRADFLAAIDALARLEAALALAELAEEQHGFSWPVPLEAKAPALLLESVRHPALPWADAVPNGIDLDGTHGVCVLTGSNMTGKSTFLKACGSALMLAQAGGPVPAAAMSWTPLRLLSDVNVRDSLDDGRSYFAVEVGRIGEVVALAEKNRFVLALLDEMFRGTNTHEKVAAGIEVTRWLAEHGALALVATHDHELTALARELPGSGIRNYHFTECIRDGKMTFDYVLREGPATSRNAIRVLAHEGFPEALVARALERSEGHGREE